MTNVFSFSGGKDSTAMILLAKEKGIRIDKIVFYNTLWEFKAIEEHVRKIEAYIGIEIEEIIPERHPMYLMANHRNVNKRYYENTMDEKELDPEKTHFDGTRFGYGWPTWGRRWCTAEKNRMLNRWMKNQPEDAVFFVGIAADEIRPLEEKKRYPLIEYGITEKEALEICYSHGFDFGGLYNYFDRVSCWCCPLGGKTRAKILWEHFPELWEKIKDMQDFLLWMHEGHESFIEGHTFEELEEEFQEYGQIHLFEAVGA